MNELNSERKTSPEAIVISELKILSDLRELEKVREFAEHVCSNISIVSFNEKQIGLIVLAVHEMTVNIIKHAYSGLGGRLIQVAAGYSHDRVWFEFFDQGVAFNPDDVPSPNFDEIREGGYGIYMIKQVCDTYNCSRDDFGTNKSVLIINLNALKQQPVV